MFILLVGYLYLRDILDGFCLELAFEVHNYTEMRFWRLMDIPSSVFFTMYNCDIFIFIIITTTTTINVTHFPVYVPYINK